jgi:hypothetical protein
MTGGYKRKRERFKVNPMNALQCKSVDTSKTCFVAITTPYRQPRSRPLRGTEIAPAWPAGTALEPPPPLLQITNSSAPMRSTPFPRIILMERRDQLALCSRTMMSPPSWIRPNRVWARTPCGHWPLPSLPHGLVAGCHQLAPPSLANTRSPGPEVHRPSPLGSRQTGERRRSRHAGRGGEGAAATRGAAGVGPAPYGLRLV